jgi:hypothetical protein
MEQEITGITGNYLVLGLCMLAGLGVATLAIVLGAAKRHKS